jgi:hypothetical protein
MPQVGEGLGNLSRFIKRIALHRIHPPIRTPHRKKNGAGVLSQTLRLIAFQMLTNLSAKCFAQPSSSTVKLVNRWSRA